MTLGPKKVRVDQNVNCGILALYITIYMGLHLGMEIQAIIGQLHIVDGEPKTNFPVPGLLAQAPSKKVEKNRRLDSLFAHLTLEPAAVPGLDGDDALIQDLIDALSAAFYRTEGTINTAVRLAIRHINELLLNWNVNYPEMRREGAITCAVMRGDELYVVQVGPSLAFMGHNFGVERMPAHEPDILTPLGTTANLDFRFGHYRLQSGDMFLMVEPRMVSLATPVLQPALVDTEVEIGLAELKDVVADGSGRLLLVEFTDDPPFDFPETEGLIAPLGRNTIAPILERPSKPQRRGGLRPRLTPVESTVRRGAAAAATGASKLTDSVADVLEQIRPVDQEPPDEENSGWTLPTALAILIPVILGIIVTSVFLQWDNTQRLGQITQQMNTLLNLASEEPDEEARRTYYLEVLRLGAQAGEIRPQDGDVLRMQGAAMAQLDRLDNITRLSGTLLDLVDLDESELTSIAISDRFEGYIFVLDSGLNRVWGYEGGEDFLQMDVTERSQVLFGGQAVQSHVVGEIVDLYWRPQGTSVTQNGVAMLDRRGAILSYYPEFTNTRAFTLDLSSGWRTPTQVKGFSERLYILDNQAGFIWRYYPEGDDFSIRADDQAITFFEAVEIPQLVDFDINAADGTVVLLYKNGNMVRLADGRSIWPAGTLEDGGLTSPMLAPKSVKIVGRGSTASIFVLDTGSGRLLQFSLSGGLLAQYRASDESGRELLTRANDFAVVDQPLRVFVTADNELYVATLE